jgi:hypothetical protein
MGYLSDMTYTIVFPNVEAMKGFVAVQRIISADMKEVLDAVTYVCDVGHPYMTYTCKGCRSEASAHRALRAAARTAEFGVAYAYIGSDDDDCRTEYSDGGEPFGDNPPDIYIYAWTLCTLGSDAPQGIPTSIKELLA